jgi:fructose-specific phosphotransferase system IIC component
MTEHLKRWVMSFCAGMAGCIVGSCLCLVIAGYTLSAERFTITKALFEDVVQDVLLPMFTTVVVSALTYVFGKELVAALAFRIRRGR